MSSGQLKSLDEPDEETSFPLGHGHVVHLGGLSVGRSVHEPGWRWSEHMKPIAGTDSCRSHHAGYIVSGRMRWVMDDGTTLDGGPGDAFDIPPGHDSMVVGDEVAVTVDWAGVAGEGWESLGESVLTILLFTDIVDSTARAERVGRVAWARLLQAHHEATRLVLTHHRGLEVKTTGDGMLATFDSAARAARAAVEIRDRLRTLGLQIRASVHAGEIEVRSGDVRGIAVHEAARMLESAAPGEIVASAVVRELSAPLGLPWIDRGAQMLKGFAGARRLYVLPEGNNPSPDPAPPEGPAGN